MNKKQPEIENYELRKHISYNTNYKNKNTIDEIFYDNTKIMKIRYRITTEFNKTKQGYIINHPKINKNTLKTLSAENFLDLIFSTNINRILNKFKLDGCSFVWIKRFEEIKDKELIQKFVNMGWVQMYEIEGKYKEKQQRKDITYIQLVKPLY